MTDKEQMRHLEKFIIINYPEFYAEHLGENWSVATIKLIEKLEEEKKEKPKHYIVDLREKNHRQLNCGFKGEVTFLKNKEPEINIRMSQRINAGLAEGYKEHLINILQDELRNQSNLS